MNCEQAHQHWSRYINGQCSAQEEQLMEEHIAHCQQCEQRLEQHLEQQNNFSRMESLDSLPMKKQQRIIQKAKWKNRFSNTATVLGFIVMLLLLATVFTNVYFAIGNKTERARLTIQTVTQMTMPNVYSWITHTSINTLFNAELTGELFKVVGSENQVIAQLDGKMVLNQLHVDRNWSNGVYNNQLYFVNPKANPSYDVNDEQAWDTLSMLPEGTVSEIAVTFDQPYSFHDVFTLFNNYDLFIAWYGIDTGTITQQQSARITIGQGAMGLHEHAVFDFMLSGTNFIEKEDDGKREEAFKDGLRFLADNEKYVKQYGWWLDEADRQFDEQLAYVNENGINLYGVVITGPTNELLKLKENEHIIYSVLGEIDFWNWSNPGPESAFYN